LCKHPFFGMQSATGHNYGTKFTLFPFAAWSYAPMARFCSRLMYIAPP